MLSIPHLVIIFLIALIVLGPEKLPQVARVLGKVMADFRRITGDFRMQIEDEMREMERHTKLQEMNQVEASPFKPTDPELLGAVPATPAPTNPAEVPPPPAGFTSGGSEPAATVPAHSAAEIPAAATVSEKPADGEPKPA